MRLAICSSKGGVGKTSTAANLGTVFGERGRTLVVDADAQESLGRAFGVVAGADDSLAGLLADPTGDVRAILRRDVVPGVDLLPAHTSLEATGRELAQQGGLVSSLRRALRPVEASYADIVIDTHADTGSMTLAALGAADAVLTLFTSDPGSALGAVRVASFVETHRRCEDTEAVLLGVVCANWDRRGAAAREVADALAGTSLPILRTRIPYSRRVPSSTLTKQPVVLVAPRSPVALAYRELAAEVRSVHKEVLAA